MLQRLGQFGHRNNLILVLVCLKNQLFEPIGHAGGDLVRGDHPIVVRIEPLEKRLGIWPFGPFWFLCRQQLRQDNDR